MLNLLDEIVSEVVRRIEDNHLVEVEASGRHIHLSQEDLDALFGKGYTLTKAKSLSQPGEFACKERVDIIGPKGTIKNVVILGPVRKATQAEISLTDTRALGVVPPVKLSGDIENTPGFKIQNGNTVIEKSKGLIIAKRHIHIEEKDAAKFNVKDGEIVQVKIFSDRSLIFDDVVIRISPKFKTFMHIDYDEANACGFKTGTKAMIIKKN